MKVILSRKGFDSANGGLPSLIMPNGEVVSMPIPSPGDANSYDQLRYGKKTYRQILKELAPKKRFARCHLDPDLDACRLIKKPCGWKPAFGQIGSSSSYLLNTVGLQPGDIFLFFGNFRRVEEVDGKYRFVRRTGVFYQDNPIQLIWGYLQVGEIITDGVKIKARYPWHPHSKRDRLREKTNILVVPRKHLSFSPSRPGCGLLRFDLRRVLTKLGANKATWKFNSVYGQRNIIAKNRRNNSKTGVFYPGIWQELGLKDTPETTAWAKEVILGR